MKPQPPNRSLRFLRWFCKDEYLEEFEGDLIELYEQYHADSPKKAKRKFFWEVMRCFRPEFIKSIFQVTPHYRGSNTTAMFKHNLLIAFRNFKRHKVSFFINLIGLTTGLSCALLIFLWVNDEKSMDKFYKHEARLYQVMEHFQQDFGVRTVTSTSGLMASALKLEVPEVETAAVTGAFQDVNVSVEEKLIRANGLYTSEELFKIFSYEFLHRNEEMLFPDKSSIVISEQLALKLFGTTNNIIGRDIVIQQDKKYFVSGVFENIPSNASEQFDFALPYSIYEELFPGALEWGNSGNQVYVLLQDNVNVDQVNDKIKDYINIKTDGRTTFRTPFLKRYSTKYLYGEYKDGKQSGGRVIYVKLFSAVAVLILIVGCINFMNLSTSQASRRLKEVGVKKVMGIQRMDLVSQYLQESMLIVFISAAVSVVLTLILLPWFNVVTGKVLTLAFDLTFVVRILLIVVTTGFLAGSYPAFYLSGFKLFTILKGNLKGSWSAIWIRKGLVVFQFIVSLVLIVAVTVIDNQIQFIQEKDLGYDRENIISFRREGKLMDDSSFETFLTELGQLPGVTSASSISHDLAGHAWGVGGPVWKGKNPEDETEFELVPVHYNMLETLGMELVQGRSFSKDFGSEFSSIIFNESAIKLMGLKDPIGEPIKGWGPERQIVGVVKDFHFESLHQNIKPLAFLLWSGRTNRVMAKIQPGSQRQTLQAMEKLHLEHNPGFPIQYQFLDQIYKAQYVSEQKVAVLSKYFTGFTILISMMGLFALVNFTAERRFKEIGIRKILGLSSFGIFRLLSQGFSRLILISMVIGLPIGFFASKSWLDNFIYKIDMEVWFFLSAGILTWVVALFTVLTQAAKISKINPIECLRDE
ncbi:ABC transporter permease [Roseivirga sp.]|uniref:ABC transporter permease n=1 Tax=Roseivirga sp. TaxID=1964215 RepID=UPI003B8C520B